MCRIWGFRGFRIQDSGKCKYEDSGFRFEDSALFFTRGFRIQFWGFSCVFNSRIQVPGFRIQVQFVIIQIGLKPLHVTTTGDRAGLFVIPVSPKHRREFCPLQRVKNTPNPNGSKPSLNSHASPLPNTQPQTKPIRKCVFRKHWGPVLDAHVWGSIALFVVGKLLV